MYDIVVIKNQLIYICMARNEAGRRISLYNIERTLYNMRVNLLDILYRDTQTHIDTSKDM